MLLGQEQIAFFLGLFLVWLLGLTFFLYRNIAHYQNLVKNNHKANLQEILEKILKTNEITQEEIAKLKKRFEIIEDEALEHIQKIGLIRFNPFSDTGGSQSFTLAVLDGNNSGILISSLHSRDQTRMYTKQIKDGKGVGFELSKEEKEAIEKAIK